MQQMYWYDIILIANEYHDMMEESEKNNKYTEDFENQKMDMQSKFNSMSSSSNFKMPNMSSISSGFKMPTL